MNPLELMRIDADTSFTYDARGRLLRTNEPPAYARRPAPRVFVGRTLTGAVVRFGAAVPDALVSELQTLLSAEPPPRELGAPLACRSGLLAALGPVTEERGGPAYDASNALTPRESVTPITTANRELARDTYPWLFEEVADWQPCFGVVRDAAVVSVCFSARSGPRAAAAGVDTLPDFRQRGYAAAVSAAWARAMVASGRLALYSTGWENLASQGVARRLHLPMFGEHLSWV